MRSRSTLVLLIPTLAILLSALLLASCSQLFNISESDFRQDADLFLYEPDNSMAEASYISLGGINSEKRNVYPSGDADWIRFDAVAGNDYIIDTYSTAGSGTKGPDDVDVYMVLYDTDGATVLDEADDGGLTTGFARINWTCPSSGSYYVCVTDYNTAFDLGNGKTGNYMLGIIELESPFEPDDAYTQATSIGYNTANAQTHDLSPQGDEDWVSFVATAGTHYIIETYSTGGFGMSAGGDVDTYIYLYDTNGTTILFEDDDGGASPLYSRIEWVAPGNGTYYVKITDYETASGTGPGLTGEYVIRIQAPVPLHFTPNNPGIGTWNDLPNTYPVSPPPGRDFDLDGQVYYYGDPAVWNYDFSGLASAAYLDSDPISLNTNGGFYLLSYRDWLMDEGPGTEEYEKRSIWVSVNFGSTWNLLHDLSATGEPPDDDGIWREHLFDLSAYAGQTVMIRFAFDTYDNFNNTYEGWYLDKIEVFNP
jgi:hypothetical protein